MAISTRSDQSREIARIRANIAAFSADTSPRPNTVTRVVPGLLQAIPSKASRLGELSCFHLSESRAAKPSDVRAGVRLFGAGIDGPVMRGVRLEHSRRDSQAVGSVPTSRTAGANEVVTGHRIAASIAGGGQPPFAQQPTSDGSNDDFSYIGRYANALLGENAVLLDTAQLRGIMALRTDARYQEAISAQTAGAMLIASGLRFARFLAEEDIARAEWQLISALRTNIAQFPRMMLSSKETIEEALKVFNDAHARFSRDEKLPDELQMIARYLEPDFPAGTDPETIAGVARAIVDIPHSTAMRRIGHLVRLAACMEKIGGPSLGQLLELAPQEADAIAWRELRTNDQGGVAAMETFWDWYCRYADVGETNHREASKPLLDPDSFAEMRAEQFAAESFRKSFPEILEAALREYGKAERDELTRFYQARNFGVLDSLVEIAAGQVDRLDGRVWYVELDIINMGGLNKHFQDVHARADPHIKKVCYIFMDVLSRHSDQIVPFRIAGDEFGFIFVGCDEDTVRAMLREVEEQVREYVDNTSLGGSKRLADLKKAKVDGQDGFGAHYGYARFSSKSTAKSIREVAARMINRSKEGMPPMLGS